jgi:ribosomal protein S18 acetylase RimI-like enzyme
VAHGLTEAAASSLRPALEDDRPFLLDVYASTRADELALVSWTDDEKEAFIAQQYAAQDATYRARYPDGSFLVIEVQGRPVGRLYLARLMDEIRVVDIALLPAARGQGIGTALLRGVLGEAEGKGLVVRLHVEAWNPAMRLYQRLGFRRLETRGIYEFMEWRGQPVS